MKVEENHVHNQGLNFCFDLLFLHLWSGWRRRWSNHSSTLRLSAYRIYMRGTDLKPHCLLNPGRVFGALSLPHSTSSSVVSHSSLFSLDSSPQANAADCPSGERFLSVPGWVGGLGDQLTLALLLGVCSLLAARPPPWRILHIVKMKWM